MKVGLSFSRCIRDIVEARVEFDDVLVVVSRTDFDPHNGQHWEGIWDGYRYGGMSNPEWAGAEPTLSDEEASNVYRNVAKQLYDSGKFHQPRQFGAHPPRMPYYWLECVMTPEEHNPAQQKAWDNYKLITDLA
ncbi:hypothetical protein N9D61_01925 [Planktomarina sp.]|jgi:hypothetical protein|nr:hypothetical protein [Planktomarina sp.]